MGTLRFAHPTLAVVIYSYRTYCKASYTTPTFSQAPGVHATATDQTATQLDQYYRLNVQHLRWSFGSSLTALFAGLCALLVGIGLVVAGDRGLASQLTVIGGVLTQFIGAGFFFLNSRYLKQLNVFYDKLIKHQDTLYAISLANSIAEPSKSSAIQAVIGSLLSRGEPPFPPEVLAAFAPGKATTAPSRNGTIA